MATFEIANTVFNLVIYCVFYLIYFYLMNKITEKNEFKYWNLLNYFCILLLSIVFISLPANLYSFLLYLFSFILYSTIFYWSTLRRHIISVFTFYLLRSLGIYLLQLILTAIIDITDIQLTYYVGLSIKVLLFISSLLILFIITKLLLTKTLVDDGNEFTNNQFTILLFPSIVGVISLYMFTNYSDDKNNFDISSILLALATVCVVFILVYLANIKTLHAKEKSEAAHIQKEKFLQESMDIQYNYFQAVQNTQQDLRTVQHDLNHHLTSIDAMAELKDINGVRSYIADIRKVLKPSAKIYDTGTGILDVILNEKHTLADSKGIKFMVVGTFEGGCSLDPMSISVIFANLIDNAIEACDRMKNPNVYKRVQVSFYQDTENAKEIFISVENTYDEGSITKNDKDEIVTSKEDKKMHGIGLQSVKSEVGKYGGTIQIESTGGSFKITITIPIK